VTALDANFYGGPMFDTLFSFFDPIMEPTEGDLAYFIAQREDLFESSKQFKAGVEYQGNPYELHLMLQSLKSGNMDFAEFMVEARAWSTTVLNG
jgi:hypothetical protein